MRLETGGLAGNSCPLCEKTTRVPLLYLLDVRGRPDSFPCSSCRERLVIARSTKQMALYAALVSIGATFLVLHALGPSITWLGMAPRPQLLLLLVVSAAFFVPLFAIGRLALRLEPATDGRAG